MIINLTQHTATPEQVASGVVDLPLDERQDLIEALTFNLLPNEEEVEERAQFIAELGLQWASRKWGVIPDAAMIGGAPWLMPALVRALIEREIRPLYAFSVRETEEVTLPDGSVKKVSTFRHVGFVPAA